MAKKRNTHRNLWDISAPLASEIIATADEWLWTNYIPLGHLTLLAGESCSFKTTMMMDVIARLSTGRAMPGVAAGVHLLGHSVILTRESNHASEIVPKLEAAGADKSQITLPDVRRLPSGGPERLRWLLEYLTRIVGERANVKLLMMDPLADFFPESARNVRDPLMDIETFAAEHNLAIVAVRHLSKHSGGSAFSRVRGSGDLTAFARHVLFVGRHPNGSEDERALTGVSNLTRHTGAMTFGVKEVEGLPGRPIRIVWRGWVPGISADDIMNGHGVSRVSEFERAAQFLKEQLASGPVASVILQEKASQAGVSLRTLKRVQALDPGLRKTKTPAGWAWSLVGSLPKGAAMARSSAQVGQLGQLGQLAPILGVPECRPRQAVRRLPRRHVDSPSRPDIPRSQENQS